MIYSAYKLNKQVTIYSLDILFSQFGNQSVVSCLVLCCFLTWIQISQEAGKMVWYSHLFKNFPLFVVMHTVKGFGIPNNSEVDFFLIL